MGLLHIGTGYGDELPDRSLKLDKAIASSFDRYTLQFTLPNPQILGSIKLEFCSESPLVGALCTPPVGMDMTTGTLLAQSGETGFTLSGSTTANTIILTRTAIASTATNLAYTFDHVTNPSNAGTYFARVQTFASNNASGGSIDQGGIAFSINTTLQLSATVPPYLYFCLGVAITDVDCTTATGDYINFGEFTPVLATVAETQMVAGTNADTGYDIIVNGTTLTSGNNVIPALATGDVSRPGTNQFGMNLVANQDPQVGQNPSGSGSGAAQSSYNNPNVYRFVSNDVVANVLEPDEPRKYTTSYIVNISKSQPPGIYVSTLTYVATGGF